MLLVHPHGWKITLTDVTVLYNGINVYHCTSFWKILLPSSKYLLFIPSTIWASVIKLLRLEAN